MVVDLLPFLFPLLFIIFLPFLQDFYDTGRWITMVIATLFLFLIYGFRLLKTKKISLSIPNLSYGFGALTVAAIISILAVSTNKIESIVHPLGVVTYACLFFITLLLPQILHKEQKDRMIWAIIVVLGCIGLLCIYQQFAITSILFPGATYLKNNLWNPTGTPISALFLFALGIPLALSNIRSSFAHHKERLAALGIVCGVFMMAGLGITIWRFAPLIPTVVMPIPVGWATLLEALKSGKTAVFGVGAENFLSAYALGRPIAMNQTALWNTGFSTNATLLFHITTTLGLLGFVACVIFLISWFRSMPKTIELRSIWIAAAIAFVALPPSIPLLLFMALVFVAETKPTTQQPIQPLMSITVILCIIAGCIASCIGVYHFTKGEILYAQAGTAVQTENNLTKAYTDHILAIKQNQYMTRYHISLSQIALVMGGSILAQAPKNETTGQVTLLDEDKSLITSLFSLAVSEAKLATTLAPNSYVAWTNLATVYQSLIGVAGDADTWTIAAYQKAISLNPISPTIRIDFGGMYMNAKDYDNAITQFLASITLKPNYANAYYNLANAYKTKGDTERALDALIKTQTLLPQNGTEYTKVQEEIQTLQTQTPVPTPTPKTETKILNREPTPIPLIP